MNARVLRSICYLLFAFSTLALGSCAVVVDEKGNERYIITDQQEPKPNERVLWTWDPNEGFEWYGYEKAPEPVKLYSVGTRVRPAPAAQAKYAPKERPVRVPTVAEHLGIPEYLGSGWSYGLSGALTYPHTNFIDRGSASGSAGALCADVSKDLWGSGLRYAGEFSGFRIAGTASACQGFGTASQFVPLGGFDGKTSFSTFFTAGGRVELPLNLGGLRIVPFAGAGGAYAHVKVQAFPFESNSSWRSGAYWEVGASVPVSPKVFGLGAVQGIDAVSAEVYASWKRIGVGHQTLDGGAPTKTDLDMIVGGARIKY
jgi:hypothetical protein